MANGNGFDVQAARQAGYSDDEILQHLTQSRSFDIDGARRAGYSNQEIIDHLAQTSAPPPASRMSPQALQQNIPMDPSMAGSALNTAGLPVKQAPKPTVAGSLFGLATMTPSSEAEPLVSAVKEDVKGFAKGAAPALAGPPGIAAAMATQGIQHFRENLRSYRETGKTLTQRHAEQQKTEGYGPVYRNVSTPLASAIGVDVPGMESAAGRGEESGVLGKTAVPAASWLAPTLLHGAGEAPRVPEEPGIPRGAIADAVNKPQASPGIQRGAITEGVQKGLTRAEITKEAGQQGIPMGPAEARGSTLGKKVQAVGENSLLGGIPASKHSAAIRQGFEDWYNRSTEQILPSEQIQGGDIGQHIQGQLNTALQSAKEQSAADFAAVNRQTKDVTIDTAPIRKWAEEKLNETSPERHAMPSLDPKKATEILREMQNLPPRIDFATAQGIRSRLLKVGHVGSDIIPEEAQAWSRAATSVFDQEMVNAAKELSPEAEGAFRKANDFWKRTVETFNDPRSPIHQAMQEKEPARVPQKFLQPGSAGGSPKALRDFRDYVGDIRPLQREFLTSIIEKMKNGDLNFGSMKKRMGHYSNEFLSTLYEPEQLSHLKKMAEAGSSAFENVNPSGSEKLHGIRADVSDTLAAMAAPWTHGMSLAVPAAKYPLAKIMSSRRLGAASVGLTLRDVTPPEGGPPRFPGTEPPKPTPPEDLGHLGGPSKPGGGNGPAPSGSPPTPSGPPVEHGRGTVAPAVKQQFESKKTGSAGYQRPTNPVDVSDQFSSALDRDRALLRDAEDPEDRAVLERRIRETQEMKAEHDRKFKIQELRRGGIAQHYAAVAGAH